MADAGRSRADEQVAQVSIFDAARDVLDCNGAGQSEVSQAFHRRLAHWVLSQEPSADDSEQTAKERLQAGFARYEAKHPLPTADASDQTGGEGRG